MRGPLLPPPLGPLLDPAFQELLVELDPPAPQSSLLLLALDVGRLLGAGAVGAQGSSALSKVEAGAPQPSSPQLSVVAGVDLEAEPLLALGVEGFDVVPQGSLEDEADFLLPEEPQGSSGLSQSFAGAAAEALLAGAEVAGVSQSLSGTAEDVLLPLAEVPHGSAAALLPAETAGSAGMPQSSSAALDGGGGPVDLELGRDPYDEVFRLLRSPPPPLLPLGQS